MKRLFGVFAAIMMAALPLAAESASEAVSREVKSFDVDNFDALDVSWIYKVELTQSRNQSVTIEAPDFIMDYLDVKVRKSRLILSVRDMPASIRRKVETGKYEVLATVSMKKLSSLEMSGASKLFANGQFHSNNDIFRMELSGASSVKDLYVIADNADLDCSGASKFDLKGKLKDVKLALSGAAKADIYSDIKSINMDISGAGKITMNGTVGDLLLSGSGAAKIDMLDCPVLWADVDLSGASKASIEVHETLKIRASGASTLTYKAGDKLQILDTDVSRGATLRRL